MKTLYREDFGIINFNYDTLLDRAFQDIFNFSFRDLDDYLNRNYFKPHGSVNWFLRRRTPDKTIQGELSQDIRIRLNIAAEQFYKHSADRHSMANLFICDPTHLDLTQFRLLLKPGSAEYYYPLVFTPLTTKMYSMVEDFEGKIIEGAKKLISTANQIYIIGYRAVDEIIEDILSVAKPQTLVQIISKSDVGYIQERIKTIAPNLNIQTLNQNGFMDFVKQFQPTTPASL